MTSKQEPPTSVQSMGGVARDKALTPERRREIARQGGLAKSLAKKAAMPKATHRGTFKEKFDIDVECYVLDDERKTAVISRRGMGAALKLTGSGHALPRFLQGDKIRNHVGAELAQKLANPLVFQLSSVVSNLPPSDVHGYDVTILIDICNAILAADEAGDLLKRQQHLAKQARVIVNATAKYGITQVVYALAGYDQTRAERIAAFKLYVAEEARGYEKEFPDGLYEEWYRLYDLPKPKRNKPWLFRTLTLDHVWKPLAQSNGKILELTRALKAKSNDRRKRLHQFLSEVGVKALRSHLGVLHGIAMFADDSTVYKQRVEQAFGKPLKIQTAFDF
jgi:hypothetical protein